MIRLGSFEIQPASMKPNPNFISGFAIFHEFHIINNIYFIKFLAGSVSELQFLKIFKH